MGEPQRGEWARHWRFEELPGLDLLRARYVRHTFRRHSHEGFTLGAVSGGVEDVQLPEGLIRARPGTVVMINPEVPHSARAGDPDGWTYSTLYPSVGLIAAIADEVSTLRGTPVFGETIVEDPQAAELIKGVHRAAEAGNALAADSLLRVAVARLLGRHGSRLPPRGARPDSGSRTAALARAVLEERMADPPSLERLAGELGTSPFALLRAFRRAYGMPPHTWLTDARVRRARRLLDSGGTPAEAAVAVGFTDQPHLNRHFTRIVGVPPGAYRRERAGRLPASREDGPAGERPPAPAPDTEGTAPTGEAGSGARTPAPAAPRLSAPSRTTPPGGARKNVQDR
ncbi:AraC family ligand binding domain-containing protein [Streptomyces sp. CAU 1734]|uniref:AraC family transcriptional regulator n=1 Tax=Streptomyces sp. CAU 1734 TaxID=3140360 RepID=UPI003261B2B9